MLKKTVKAPTQKKALRKFFKENKVCGENNQKAQKFNLLFSGIRVSCYQFKKNK